MSLTAVHTTGINCGSDARPVIKHVELINVSRPSVSVLVLGVPMLAGNCAAQLLTLPLFALPPLTTYLLIYCEINREWRLPYFHYRDLHRNRLRPSIPVLEDFIFVSTNHGQVWFRSHPSPQNFRSILTRPNEIYFHPHSIPFCKAIVRSFILYCRPSALRPRSGKKKEEKRRKLSLIHI